MSKVTVSISGNAQQFLADMGKRYTHLDNSYVVAGWPGGEKYADGTSVASVATFSEFGTHNSDGSLHTPARPFIRPAYNDNTAAITALRIKVMQDVATGASTPEHALQKMGFQLVTFIQAKIRSNPAPPLAARTLAKKRAAGRPAVTLIDTRRMLDTVTYKIYMDGDQPPPADTKQVTGGSSMRPAAPKGPSPKTVRTPDAIRAEKKALRDELKRAKKGTPPGAGNNSPNGGKKVGSAGNAKKKSKAKQSKPKLPKQPKAKAPKKPAAPKGPRVKRSKTNKGMRRVTKRVTKSVRKVAKAVRKGAKRSLKAAKQGLKRLRKAVKRAQKQIGRHIRRTVKASRKTVRKLTRAAMRQVRKSLRSYARQVRKLAKGIRKMRSNLPRKGRTSQHSLLHGLETSLLHAIIRLARGTSSYGRKLY